MRATIVGIVHKYLPCYGIAWVSSSAPDAISICEILDNRCSKYLQEWLTEVARTEKIDNPTGTTEVCLVTQSGTIRDEVTNILSDVLGTGNHIKITRKSRNDIEGFVDDASSNPLAQSYKLLPELAMESRSLFRTVFPELASCTQVKWVGRIAPGVTTLTRYNAFMLGVVENANGFLSKESGTTLSTKISLVSFLNKCATAMGKRRVEPTLLHPLMDVSLLTHKLSLMKLLMDDRILRNKIQNVCLSKSLDIDKLTYQLSTVSRQDENMKKRLVVNNFASLSRTIASSLTLIRILDSHDLIGKVTGIEQYLMAPLKSNLSGLKKLYDLINHVFVVEKLESAIVDPTTIILNPDLVDVAAKSKQQVEETNEAMERIRAKAENDLCGTNTGKIKLTNTPNGKVMRAPKSVDVTNKYKLIRVNKNETQFTTAKLEELNERLASTNDLVESCERAFIAKALDVAKTYLDPLKEFADLIGNLDLGCSIAGAVSLINQDGTWCIPEFLNGATKVEIELGRHPLLEIQESLRGRLSSIVANSAKLNESRRSLLITGPNMGGKSTYARQIALHCVLAQVGIPCPSRATRITPVELIWTRVGAHDSPAGGASTFMTEASETAIMLSAVMNARGPACVVLDELGRGTSASDGLAFAAAVLKKLLAFDTCVSVFATHFHELAGMPLDGVHSLCMPSPSSALSTGLPAFSYKVEDGVESDSDGILLAKAFGFPASVIERALLLVKD